MPPAQILISTVGTSLFWPNLEGLRKAHDAGTAPDDQRDLAEAYQAKDWSGVAQQLQQFDPNMRLLGAEINSITSLITNNYADKNCGLFFLHSDTDDGRAIATVLTEYYTAQGHSPVEAVAVADLQDQDPERFKIKGLRNLARELCRILRERSPGACAINATGGYKAQIAIGVLLGQALSVPVYYKHERFQEGAIIAFPPMPVSLDLDVWLTASGMLFDLARTNDAVPYSAYESEWNEKYEALIERITIDGKEYLELSATGQIFFETFRDRFARQRDTLLPRPAETKREPRIENSGWPGEHPEVERFLRKITDEIPQVVQCSTTYYNPDLPERTRFRLSAKGLIGIFSNGTYTVKFRVESTANTEEQLHGLLGLLNEWLADHFE